MPRQGLLTDIHFLRLRLWLSPHRIFQMPQMAGTANSRKVKKFSTVGSSRYAPMHAMIHVAHRQIRNNTITLSVFR